MSRIYKFWNWLNEATVIEIRMWFLALGELLTRKGCKGTSGNGHNALYINLGIDYMGVFVKIRWTLQLKSMNSIYVNYT